MNQRINNADDYAWAENWVDKFRRAYTELKDTPLGDEHPLLRKAQLDSMLSVIEGWETEMKIYRGKHGREEKTTDTSNGESGLEMEGTNIVGLD